MRCYINGKQPLVCSGSQRLQQYCMSILKSLLRVYHNVLVYSLWRILLPRGSKIKYTNRKLLGIFSDALLFTQMEKKNLEISQYQPPWFVLVLCYILMHKALDTLRKDSSSFNNVTSTLYENIMNINFPLEIFRIRCNDSFSLLPGFWFTPAHPAICSLSCVGVLTILAVDVWMFFSLRYIKHVPADVHHGFCSDFHTLIVTHFMCNN